MFTTKKLQGYISKNFNFLGKNLIFAYNGRLEDKKNSITCFDAYHIVEHIVCYTNVLFLQLSDHFRGNKWTFTYCPFLRTLDTNGLKHQNQIELYPNDVITEQTFMKLYYNQSDLDSKFPLSFIKFELIVIEI